MTYEERVRSVLHLPKSHPLRFITIYGLTPDTGHVTLEEARRLVWRFTHPFGADLLACAETNS